MAPRLIKRLSARAVTTLTKHGRHADGGGLYLSISPNGGKRCTFLYRRHGRPTEIGLGSAREGHVTLALARELATEARIKIARGIDPKRSRRPTAGSTFAEVADRLIAAKRSGWRSEKHAAQWEMTLKVYAAPLRKLSVDKITTADVLSVLKPLWGSKPETASRLRSRIEMVLDAAKAEGLREGENPASWRGNLKHLLGQPSKLARGHHAAMDYADVPAFTSDLRAREDIPARALEFAIVTAARTAEVLGARWQEIDIDRGIWTIPAARMKAGREHRVPLSARAVEIVKAMHEVRIGEHVFPGQLPGRPLTAGTLGLVLRRAGIEGATVHGFRSSFRDWAGNVSSFPREVVETALAHAIGDKAEQAYRRSDALEKRRKLMEAWAAYCARTNTVVPLRASR